MSEEKRGTNLRIRKNMDKLLNILFEWDFAERLVDEHLTYEQVQKELKEKHNLEVIVDQLKRLEHKWYCEYDSEHNIKGIYRMPRK